MKRDSFPLGNSWIKGREPSNEEVSQAWDWAYANNFRYGSSDEVICDYRVAKADEAESYVKYLAKKGR